VIWGQVKFDAAVLHARRVKNGTPSTHPLIGDGGDVGSGDTQITTSRNPAAIFVDSLIRPRGGTEWHDKMVHAMGIE
jgi:hypothetical protein